MLIDSNVTTLGTDSSIKPSDLFLQSSCYRNLTLFKGKSSIATCLNDFSSVIPNNTVTIIARNYMSIRSKIVDSAVIALCSEHILISRYSTLTTSGRGCVGSTSTNKLGGHYGSSPNPSGKVVVPLYSGGGGGCGQFGGNRDCSGGGVIIIVSSNFTLYGNLISNGFNGTYNVDPKGSGLYGGINIYIIPLLLLILKVEEVQEGLFLSNRRMFLEMVH